MKRILYLLVFLSLLIGSAAAYELSISAPTTVQAGKPIIVNGTTNLQPGTTVEVVLSRSEYTSTEVARKSVTIQSARDFTLVFDTKGFVKGTYKLEVLPVPGINFLGDSVTLRSVQLIDRSDEITLKSPIKQEYNGQLRIEGSIRGLKSAGVQINVTDDTGKVIFGPEYIATNSDGVFSKQVQIQKSGAYDVEFSDDKGFIGVKTFTVDEIPTVTTPVPTEIPTIVPSLSASALVSPDSPAYFKVTTMGGPVRVFTSTGIDLVIEYPDAQGAIQKVNKMGALGAEEVTITGNRDVVYVKVYPYKFADKGTITLHVENASSIDVSTAVPTIFSGTTGATATTSTTKSPLPVSIPVLAALAGLGVAAYIRKTR
ncbi:MAG: hypothetical protein LUQ69_04955 [Methanoregulaceae archaeon]|nr:hypothetical protein [Methanoregulaceae archaeon]